MVLIYLNKLEISRLVKYSKVSFSFLVRSPGTSVEEMCPPMWDRASCFPATAPGQLSIIPCMAEFKEVYYDTTGRTLKFDKSIMTQQVGHSSLTEVYYDTTGRTLKFDRSLL